MSAFVDDSPYRVVLSRRFIEKACPAGAALVEYPLGRQCPDPIMADRQLFGELCCRQHTLLPEHLPLGVEALSAAHVRDHARVEWLTSASGAAAPVEDVRDLGVRMVLQQLGDFGRTDGGELSPDRGPLRHAPS